MYSTLSLLDSTGHYLIPSYTDESEIWLLWQNPYKNKQTLFYGSRSSIQYTYNSFTETLPTFEQLRNINYYLNAKSVQYFI